jgi:hypothetical protein
VRLHSPGRIILAGVLAIGLLLIVVVLLPLPSVDRALNRFIPPGAKQGQRARGQTLCAITLTTTQDIAGVLDFYSRRLGLRQRVSPRGGMTAMTRGRILGGYVSDTIMPLTGSAGEAIMLTHRDSRQIAVIAISRATNESATHIFALLERLPDSGKRAFYLPTNAALAWPPSNGKPGSSGMGLGVAVAEFGTDAPFEDTVRHYGTHLLLSTPPAGLSFSQNGTHGQAVFFAKPWGTRESFYIFCFRDNATNRTQVSVSWVAK